MAQRQKATSAMQLMTCTDQQIQVALDTFRQHLADFCSCHQQLYCMHATYEGTVAGCTVSSKVDVGRMMYCMKTSVICVLDLNSVSTSLLCVDLHVNRVMRSRAESLEL